MNDEIETQNSTEPAPTSETNTPLTDSGIETPAAAPEPLDLEKLDWSIFGEDFSPTEEDTAFIQELGELGVSQAAMQKMLEAYGTNIASLRDSVNEEVNNQWETTTSGWYDALKEKYGSEQKIKAAADRLAPVLNQFGGDEFKEALAVTGMGYHPAMFDFMEKIAEKIGEASPVNANAPGRQTENPFAALYKTSSNG